jgi:UDP-glucuronate 4-epimerase
MAIFSFTQAILSGKPIDVFNYGRMRRDFTYIDDVVEGVIQVAERAPVAAAVTDPNGARSAAPYKIYNIGNNNPVELLELIDVLEKALGRKAIRNLLPLQPGDVPATYADIDDLIRDTGFRPRTPIEEGIRRFVDWYEGYFGTGKTVDESAAHQG